MLEQAQELRTVPNRVENTEFRALYCLDGAINPNDAKKLLKHRYRRQPLSINHLCDTSHQTIKVFNNESARLRIRSVGFAHNLGGRGK